MEKPKHDSIFESVMGSVPAKKTTGSDQSKSETKVPDVTKSKIFSPPKVDIEEDEEEEEEQDYDDKEIEELQKQVFTDDEDKEQPKEKPARKKRISEEYDLVCELPVQTNGVKKNIRVIKIVSDSQRLYLIAKDIAPPLTPITASKVKNLTHRKSVNADSRNSAAIGLTDVLLLLNENPGSGSEEVKEAIFKKYPSLRPSETSAPIMLKETSKKQTKATETKPKAEAKQKPAATAKTEKVQTPTKNGKSNNGGINVQKPESNGTTHTKPVVGEKRPQVPTPETKPIQKKQKIVTDDSDQKSLDILTQQFSSLAETCYKLAPMETKMILHKQFLNLAKELVIGEE